MHQGGGIKEKHAQASRLSSGFLGTEHFGQLLGGHSATAISVPPMEYEYFQVEQCALFIHLLVLRLVLDTLS